MPVSNLVPMNNLTPQVLQNLQVIFNAQFQDSYLQTPTVWDKIASLIPVNNAGQVVSGWLDRLPQFHQWTDTRVIDQAIPRDWVTNILDWQATIEIDRNTILDDRIGLYTATVMMQAEQAKKYPDFLLRETIQNGTSAVTWDGADFFGTNHPVNINVPAMGVQSNLFTGTPLTWNNYGTVRSSMQSLTGADSLPLYVTPNVLLVPPQLEVQAKNIIHADLVSVPVNAGSGVSPGGVGPVTNTLKNTAEVVVMPELANDATSWYLIDASKPLRPFIFANRQAPQFQMRVNPNDPNVFMQKKFLYGWDARGATDYGLWFLAARASA